MILNLLTALTGGGGLEYETGTWSPSSDTSRGTINFSNSHNKPPAIFAIDMTSTTKPSNNSARYTYGIDLDALLGRSRNRYEATYVRIGYYNSSGGNGLTQYNPNHSGEDSGDISTSYWRYFATESVLRPYSGASSVYWRNVRTYSWTAIWV